MSDDEKLALRIVTAIETDMRDRRGFRQLFDSLDADIKQEVRKAWRRIALVEIVRR